MMRAYEGKRFIDGQWKSPVKRLIEEVNSPYNNGVVGTAAVASISDVDMAIRAAREIDSGVVHINWTPLRRADLMPYGGLKASGVGKEGVRSAVEEMTEIKRIIMHGRNW